jgi:hypothetical protein
MAPRPRYGGTLRTRTYIMVGLAIASLASGAGLALAGLYPDVDNPPLSRLGLVIAIVSIPIWNAVLLRVRAEQLDDTFQAGYRLHAQHVEEAAAPGSRLGLCEPDTTEGHDQ